MAKRHVPVRPNLEQLKHQAKDLLRAFRRGDAEAVADFREHQTPTDVPTIEKPVGGIKLVKLLAAEGLAASVAEAQRLVAQGGVKVNGERVNDAKLNVGSQAGEEALIQVGSRKFLRVVFK